MGLFSKDKNKNKTTTTANLTESQKKLIDASDKASGKYVKNTGKKGVELPETSLVQPFTAAQIAGQEQALASVGAQNEIAANAAAASNKILASDPTTAGMGLVTDWKNPAAGATDFLLNKVLYPESNPALQGAIDAAVRPISTQLTEETLPAVRSGAYTTGNFGSSRQGIAEGIASGKASTAIGDTAANVANTNYQAGLGAMGSAYGNLLNASTSAYGTKTGALSDLYGTNVNAQLNALGLVPQTQSAQLAGALTTSGVGDVQQAQAQRTLDEEAYRKLYEQLAPLTSAQNLTALASATPGGSTTTTGPATTTDPISSILGGATLGTALLPGLGTVLGGVAGGVGSYLA